MNAFEFGYAAGEFTKSAAEKQARGLLTDLALYSNPFTGVPTGAYDTYKHLRGGRYLNALGSAASGALSLAGIGGIGGGVKGVGNLALRAGTGVGTGTAVGRGLANAGLALRTGGRAITTAAAPLTAAGNRLTQPVTDAVQKVLPVRPVKSVFRQPVQSAMNHVASNPTQFVANYFHSRNHPPAQRQEQQPIS